MSFGISLSAFVMSMFLVPALTALLGDKAWSPRHKETGSGPHAADIVYVAGTTAADSHRTSSRSARAR